MEESDSYSYPSASSKREGVMKAAAMFLHSSCLQKRSIEELFNNAKFLCYLKHLSEQQQNSNIKRVKPLVPKFEETQKKLKTEENQEVIVHHPFVNSKPNLFYNIPNLSIAYLETVRLGSISCSNTSNYAQNMEGISAMPEVKPYLELPVVKLEQAQVAQFSSNVKQESNQFTVKLEEEAETKTESTSEGSASPEISYQAPSITLTNPSASLDKKDMKKYEKFMELYEEYREKLNLKDLRVDEKFKQLAVLVIPNLLTHFKSKPFEAIVAAVILYACREVDHPITLKQIVSISDSKEKLINKCIFSLKEIMPSDTEVKHFKAEEFIKVMCEKLTLNAKVKDAAVKICENIQRLNFMKSIHAVTLAACCLKFACALSEHDREFEDLASAAGITKMTLKNMYRELFPYRLYFITADCKLADPQLLKSL